MNRRTGIYLPTDYPSATCERVTLGAVRCQAVGSAPVPDDYFLPPEPPDEGKPINTGISIPERLLARLDEIRARYRMSRNRLLIHIVRWYLREYDARRAPPPER